MFHSSETAKINAAFCLAITLISLGILGCSTSAMTPAMVADQYAQANNFTRLTIDGQAYTHIVYFKEQNLTDRWHVYIEGDGLPWLAKRFVASDPTPRQPLMLKLMSQDPNSAIYLGRPCYLGMNTDTNCHPWLWTHGRYSETVVISMITALTRLIRMKKIKQLTLIGHSGGGTLALLMAERLEEVDTVITLAGNLDISAWTKQHGYTSLNGSLNPAERSPLPELIQGYHFIGDNDQVIPKTASQNYVNKQASACLKVIPDCTHMDCWISIWEAILISIANGSACTRIYNDIFLTR